MVKSAIKRTLTLTAGEARAQRLLSASRDLRSAAQYRLSSRGRRSAQRLQSLRDRYRGDRCVIIGNGPSLMGMDLSVLQGEHTFGLNRIYLLFEEVGFATTFLVCVNRYVIEQSARELVAAPSLKFLSWHGRDHIPAGRDVILLRTTSRRRFSTNPASELWEGATVTFVALQLAYYLGFANVILIGVDHSFSTKGPANKLVTSSGEDRDHFHRDYFGSGYRWQLPDLGTSEIAYELARQQFEADGRQVVDATAGGKLTIFPKMDLRQALATAPSPAAR